MPLLPPSLQVCHARRCVAVMDTGSDANGAGMVLADAVRAGICAVNVRYETFLPSPQHSLMTSNCARAFTSEGGGLEFVHTELK